MERGGESVKSTMEYTCIKIAIVLIIADIKQDLFLEVISYHCSELSG